MTQEKTEAPTDKKLQHARREGQVFKSTELTAGVVLLFVFFSGSLVLPWMWNRIETLAHSFLSLDMFRPGIPTMDSDWLSTLAYALLTISLPLLLIASVVTAFSQLLQVGPLFTLRPLAPKLSRLDPVTGLKKQFELRRQVSLAKSLVVLLCVGWAVFDGFVTWLTPLSRFSSINLLDAASLGGQMLSSLGIKVAVILIAIGVADFFYQRWQFRRDQRMTKSETKREHVEAEGDPQIGQERKRLYREVVEHGVLEDVRDATVLIVNPEHIAVALAFDEEDDDNAPTVLGSGTDALALAMIRAAREAGVPVMRDVPLARALVELEVGAEIPEALFEAVAVVLHTIWDAS